MKINWIYTLTYIFRVRVSADSQGSDPLPTQKLIFENCTEGDPLSRQRVGTPPPSQGSDPLPTQRVPLCTIFKYQFLVKDPESFLKAPLAPLYMNFEGGARAEKTQFSGQIFQNSAQKLLFWPFFQNFGCGAENLAKTGLFSALGELENSIWSIFFNPPRPLRENLRCGTACSYSII